MSDPHKVLGANVVNISVILSVLQEGIVVNTCIGPNHIWYRNIIYKVDSNLVYLSLTDSFIQNMVMNGSHIMIKYSLETFEYLFEGIVSDICLTYPCHVIVKISRVEEVVNTRFFPRYNVYLASNVQPEWAENSFFCIVTNLSLGGMGFVSKNQFDYGEESSVLISFQPNVYAKCKGKVITKRVKAHFIDYSMQFTEMTEENSQILSNFLQQHEDSINIQKKDFHENIQNRI